MSNPDHPAPNTQHPTPNTQHRAPNTRLVLFDVGSTLVDPHPSARHLILRVLSKHGLDVKESDLARAEPLAYQQVADRLPFQRYGQEESGAFWAAFYDALLRTLDLPVTSALCHALYDEFQVFENWRLYDDALPVLEQLRSQGLRLGVVSNWEEWLEDLLLALQVHNLFEFVVASGPFGRAKPHPSIFLRALELAGVTPAEAVHVGDNLRDDVAGARAAGIRPIFIDRRGRHPDVDVERIETLSELPDLLT